MGAKLVPFILAMGLVVLASNILVQVLLGQWLTWGALSYPLAFLVTDLANRLHGPGAARRVVFAGFVVGLLFSIGSWVAGGALSVTLRVALGSAAAFLTAHLLDVAIFHALRRRAWWQAPLASTVVGSAVDTALFFTIAFAGALAFLEPANDVAWANAMLPLLGAGPAAPLWVSLAVADWTVKLAVGALALVPFRLLVARLAARPA